MVLGISKRTDYALLLLSALAQGSRKQFVSLKTVASKNKLPYKFLSQIASVLSESGLLESKEGVKGGYRLSRPAAAISVSEVLEALEGPLAVETCGREECVCGSACVHESVGEKMAGAVRETLQDYTVADLVGD